MKMGEIRLDQCCRLCLKEGFSLTNIFSHRSAAGDQLYRILNFIYEMKIFENDGLPSQICSPCMWRMIEFDAYKRNVRSAEEEIIRLLNQTGPRPDEAHNNSLVMKTEDTEMDGASEVVTECDTVHPEHLEEAYKAEVTEMDGASEVGIYCDTVHSECPEEAYNDSLLTKAELTETDGASEVGIDCDTIHSEETVNVNAVGYVLNCDEQVFCDPLRESTGSSDIKDFVTLEASEESVGNSFEGDSIFSTQGIADKNRDKGIPENDLRGDVVPEEQSLSAELSKSILDVTKSEVSHFKTPLSKRKRVFVCDICKMSCSTKQNLGRHVPVHYDDRPFRCNTCDKTFKLHIARYRHELRHLRDNISFGKSEKESKKNQYNCGICDKNFSTKKNLRNHLNMHSDKYKCNSCGKCFQSNGKLRSHLRIHTKEKPFKCEICLNCFSRKDTLDNHLRTHSKEKPFSCKICGKTYKRNNEKLRHELLHLRKK